MSLLPNFTLERCDSYLYYLKTGVKYDTLALRNSPVNMCSLFTDHIIGKIQEEISRLDEKRASSSSHKKSDFYHPYSQTTKLVPDNSRKTGQAWKQLSHHGQGKRGQGKASNYSQQPAKCQNSFK